MNRPNYSPGMQINRLINASGSAVGRLVKQAERLLVLETLVLNALPDDCRAYCRLASYRNGILKLQSDNAGWATNIRFQQTQIIKQLKNYRPFKEIRQVQVKVKPVYSQPRPTTKHKPISAAAARHLQEMADSFEEPQLCAALRHLAERS